MDAALARIMCLEGYARSARRFRAMSAHELFCVRNSVWPLQFVAITGNSISIASMNGRPHPSPRDGSTNACAALYSSDICTVSLNSWRRRRRRRRTGPAACAPAVLVRVCRGLAWGEGGVGESLLIIEGLVHQYYMRRDARRQFIRRKERLQLQHPDSVLSAMRRGTAPCSSPQHAPVSNLCKGSALAPCRASGPYPRTARGEGHPETKHARSVAQPSWPHAVLEDCVGSTLGGGGGAVPIRVTGRPLRGGHCDPEG